MSSRLPTPAQTSRIWGLLDGQEAFVKNVSQKWQTMKKRVASDISPVVHEARSFSTSSTSGESNAVVSFVDKGCDSHSNVAKQF